MEFLSIFLKSCFHTRFLTVIIKNFFIIIFLTYGDIWLFAFKKLDLFCCCKERKIIENNDNRKMEDIDELTNASRLGHSTMDRLMRAVLGNNHEAARLLVEECRSGGLDLDVNVAAESRRHSTPLM